MTDISSFMELERIEDNIFRGDSQDLNTGQVYGGQVLGQALVAAQHTVEEQALHSVHAYFLRRGDVTTPIVYEVDRSRDGRSFAARRVIAIQHGRPIFTLSASFQIPEDGLDYSEPLENIPAIPEAIDADVENAPTRPSAYADIRPVSRKLAPDPNGFQWWIRGRTEGELTDAMHKAVFAYMSDFGLLGSTLIPHGYGMGRDRARRIKEIVLASVDHAIWFHRPFRANDWLLYECTPISTSGARGLASGKVYNEEGVLVATTIQEGLIRPRTLKK